MTKVLKPAENNNKNDTKNLDYITIADKLWSVSWSWSNNSHPTGMVKQISNIKSQGHCHEV